MKNQALTTVLAVLLAISLTAIAALVVSGGLTGDQQVVADTPAAIQVDAGDAQTTEAGSSTGEAADQTGTDAAVTDTETVDEGATPEGPSTTSPEEPAPADPAPANPGNEPAPDPGPAAPADPAPADPGNEPAPDPGPVAPADPAPADPGNEPAPDPGPAAPADPPCEGTIIDGDCVPPILILCLLGYEQVGNECVFVGCPLGFQLEDGICEPLVLALPCPDGFIRNDAGTCVPVFVLDPPVFEPPVLDPPPFEPIFCLNGFTWVNGECVPVCPPGTHRLGGFCLPQLDFNPIQLPEFEFADLIGS